MEKKKILIYTIMRNRTDKIQQYYDQIVQLPQQYPEFDWYLSIYENDSNDGTKSIFHQMDLSMFTKSCITMANIGTVHYGSVTDEDRVRNLANARNNAALAHDFYKEVDYLMMVESDVRYPIETVGKLLTFTERTGEEFDIVSGVLWGDENRGHWDTWGTRRNADEEWGSLHPNWQEVSYGKYYVTCNGIGIFKAQAFRDGARYGYINERLGGKHDCDTAIICEEFIKRGYDKIFIDHTADIYHH